MAGFGSSIKLDGESEYQRALRQINQSLREVGSEMKVVSSSFDKNDKSTQAMAQKSEVLNKTLEQQQAKLRILTQRYNEMNATYGKNSIAQQQLTAELTKEKAKLDEIGATLGKTSKEYQDQEKVVNQLEDKQVQYNNAVSKAKTEMNQAQAVVNKTTKELDELENELDDNNDELKKNEKGWSSWGQTLADLRTKAIEGAISGLKNVGSALIDFGKQSIETAATVKASNSQFEQTFGILKEQAVSMVNEVSKSTGIIATRLNDAASGIYAFARSNGASTKEAMDLTKSALESAADSAAYYDRSLEESTETLMSFLKGNYANDAALGVSATEFTRNAKATELFGKKYNDLTEIQKQQTLLKMVTDSQKVSGAMGQAAREASGWENVQGNLNETWRQFQAKVGTPFLEALIPVIQDITKSFQEWQETVDWEQFGDNVKKAIDKVIEVFKWIIDNKELVVGSITAIIGAFAIGKIASFVNTMVTLGTTLAGIPAVAGLASTAMTVLGTAFTFLTGPIGIAITLIGAVVGAFVLLWNKSEGFKNFWIGLWDNIKSVISTAITNIITFFQELPNKISEIIQAVITFFQELPYNLGLIVGKMLGLLIKFGADAFNWAITKIPEIIDNIINFFAELPEKIWNLLVNAYNKVSQWGNNLKDKAIETGTNFLNNIINFFSQLPSRIWSLLTSAYESVSNFAINIANKGREGAKNLFDNIVNGLISLPSRVAEIGSNIVSGLWEGIKNAGGWIKDKIKGFASGILDGMKSVLGIHSPSTLFRDEVGKNIALGLGEGFTDEMKNISAEMQNSIPTDFDVNGSYNGSKIVDSINTLSNYNSLVEAFTEALEGMKIELDDEEVGSFVKKTVENAIYN